MSNLRNSKFQKAWLHSIECDPSKEVIDIDLSSQACSQQTEEIKVSVLDYELSQTTGQPTIVQVTLDLLANEKEVYVRTTSLGRKAGERIASFHTARGGEKVNVWMDGSVALCYDLGKPVWRSGSIAEEVWEGDELTIRSAIAIDLFKSATNGGYAGYRGYRLNNARFAGIKKVEKKETNA
jgi:hypothetical protein